VRHNALRGFYRYAISRGFVATAPLPLTIPERPPAFQPYIYSPAELRHLVEWKQCQHARFDRIVPPTSQ
jgi:integrase/recombinase XerD